MRRSGGMRLPSMTNSGIATTPTTASGTGNALPRYQTGTSVSATYVSVRSTTRIVSAASPPARPAAALLRDTDTATRWELPMLPAVSSIVHFPAPDKSGRCLPSIVHEKYAVWRSNEGVAAVTVIFSPGEGAGGDAISDTGAGKACAPAVPQASSPKRKKKERYFMVMAWKCRCCLSSDPLLPAG